MSDGDALLAAVRAAPDDDTPRLVYADYLDDLGEPGDAERAAFVRAQVELARVRPIDLGEGDLHRAPRGEGTEGVVLLPSERLAHVPAGAWVRVAGPVPGHGEFELRFDGQIQNIRNYGRGDLAIVTIRTGTHPHAERERELRAEEGRLWNARSAWAKGWCPEGFHVWLGSVSLPEYDTGHIEPFAVYDRGFVEAVICPAADWRAHGDSLLAAHPVRRVRLTTAPEVSITGHGEGPRWVLAGEPNTPALPAREVGEFESGQSIAARLLARRRLRVAAHLGHPPAGPDRQPARHPAAVASRLPRRPGPRPPRRRCGRPYRPLSTPGSRESAGAPQFAA